MAREVDRLLAQLAHSSPRPARDGEESGAGHRGERPVARRSIQRGGSGAASAGSDLLGLWARVLLAVILAAAMTQWPYPRTCDLPLAGYLAAVGTVVIAGAWIALVSWRRRSGVPHLLALGLLFWGAVLAAQQVLPRVGYAAERASWRCIAPARPADVRPAPAASTASVS
jgi:hypothetical protein